MKSLLRILLFLVLAFAGRIAVAQSCINLICATNKTVECDTNWVFDPPSIIDLCGCGTNYTLTIVSTTTNTLGSVPCAASADQVWQVVDCLGFPTLCTQSVTIVDTTPPMVVCAPDKTVTCGSTWIFDPPTAIDACCGTNFSILVLNTVTNANPGGCGLVASQIWDIRDCCGNITNCNQHVTILPAPPVIVCSNYSIPCGGPFPVPPAPPAVVSPCCSATTISLLGSVTNSGGCTGSIGLIWKAVDCCANSTTCTQLVSFTPSPPTLLCGQAVVQCGQPFPTNPPTWIDFCCTNLVVTPIGTPSTSSLAGAVCALQVLQAWQASNCCGGGLTVCTQRVIIIDTLPPVLTCASNKTVQCGSGWTFDPPTAFDLCCGTNLTYSFTTNAIITPIVCQTLWEGIWRVTDCCSNFSVCTQMVTEVDTLPPSITCAPNKTVQCGSAWSFDPPTGFDLCCGTNLAFSLANPIVITSTPCQTIWGGPWKLIDCCGNVSATCTQLVTEIDTIPPVITCSNKTVQCGTAWSFDRPAAFDACCPLAALTFQLLSSNLVSSTNCLSVWAGGWRVTDCCTNSSVCTQLVTVIDTTPPTLTCPSNITVNTGTPWTFGLPTAVDLCCGTNVTIVVQSTVTSSICPLTATRTWRAIDCCSNSSAPCSQTVVVQCSPVPPNDLCSSAIPVFVGSPAYCGTTACATPSTGIPNCAGSLASPDVWFVFKPVCTGPVKVDTCGVCPGSSTFNTVLSAYTGTCGSLTSIACNNNAGGACGVQSSITFTGIAGTNYYLRVSGPACASGPFRLNITATNSPPPNDLCPNAIPVNVGSPAACGTTICATPSPLGTIPIPCGSSTNSPDVWYVWTPGCSGTATIDTCGLCPGQTTTFDTVLSVYSGNCGTLWMVACNDDALTGGCFLQSRVTFFAWAGVSYYIRVAGFDTTPVGNFRLNISQPFAPPFNNPCANAITLGPSGVSMFSTCGATTDGPTQLGCQPDNDVWFRYVAPCSGQVWVDTCIASFNTVLSVYTGPCTGLSLLACNDNATAGPCSGSQQSFLTFTATAGTVYTIRIGGFGGATGWGVLRVTGPYPPAPTCPPSVGAFSCRLFQVQGTANNTPWAWSIRAPCCFNFGISNVPGVAFGSSANVLAAAFVNSINSSCGGGGIVALNLTNFMSGLFAVCITSCSNVAQPWTFSIGPAGTPVTNQCIVANIGTPIFPPTPLATTGPCSFNPPLVELPYASADLNNNGVDDAIDIMLATSADLNMNGIPDEAEPCQEPQFLLKPESQVVPLGTNVTLSVSAYGTPTLQYQWSFNGSPLPGETSSSLSINNIGIGQLGDYGVTIANACGTNTSLPFTLSVETPEPPASPVISSVTYENGSFKITFVTESGKTYYVEYKDTLTAPTWNPLTTVGGDDLEHTVVDNPPLPGMRFYRIRATTP